MTADDTANTTSSISPVLPVEGEYQSQNADILEQARKANNTWDFNGKELEMYVARGEAQVVTDIIEPSTGEKSGASLVHYFKWAGPEAFITRENSFKTNLSRIGRRVEQKISTTHLATVNSTFYQEVIDHGELVSMKNGQPERKLQDQTNMRQFSRLYPEAASEAIETWLDAPIIKRLGEGNDFSYLFEAKDKIEILWCLGSEDNPIAAGVFVFSAPSSEERANFDTNVQKVETKRQGDVSSTDIEENFKKKIQYGANHLLDIRGIAIGEEGQKFDKGMKENAIMLFNPIWFGEVVDVMHSAYDFMKGQSKSN